MKEGLLEFLNQHTAVSAHDLEELMSQVEVCNYNKKTRLTDIGETEQHMYYIISGLVRIYFSIGKEEVIKHIVTEGGLVGSAASFFSGMPSKYIVETLEPTTTLVITKRKLENLYLSGKKWEKIGRLIITKYFLMQEMQLLDNIRLSTKERLKKFMEENPYLVERVSQKYLASYLNIKPETFSRLKPNLKK